MAIKRNPEPEDDTTLGVSSPSGWRVAASGREVVLALLLIAGFVVVALLLRDLTALMREEQANRHQEHTAIEHGHRDLQCLFAIDAQYRIDALRSGNVCAWVPFTLPHPQPQIRPDRFGGREPREGR